MAKKRSMDELRQTKEYQISIQGGDYIKPATKPGKSTGEIMSESKDSYYTNPWFNNKKLDVKNLENYWVVCRDQVTGKIEINCYKDKSTAESKQSEFHTQYYNAIVLEQKDINELYLQTKIVNNEDKT